VIYFNHKEHKDRKDQILNAFHWGLSLFFEFSAFFAVNIGSELHAAKK
jgi:hypothetical protein